MLSRFVLLLLTVFWVTMNVLLVRSEFGGGDQASSRVPVNLVWQRILTAPDNSSLEIFHHGQRVGYCRWSAILGSSAAAKKLAATEELPEVTADEISDYQLQFEGNANLENLSERLRFDCTADFGTNHAWRELRVRLSLHPNLWILSANAATRNFRLHIEGDEGAFDRVIAFNDLQQPDVLARELGLPVPIGLLGFPLNTNASETLAAALRWEARTDTFQIGHTPVRAYCLKARLLNRFQIRILVSRVGEILRVELPDDLVLVNDQFSL